MPITVTPSSANIKWTVSQTTYTPEEYFILYSSDNFTNVNLSATDGPAARTDITGLQFITGMDLSYNYTITGLNISVSYSFMISSVNTAGTNSVQGEFTTAETSEPFISLHIFVVYFIFNCTPAVEIRFILILLFIIT